MLFGDLPHGLGSGTHGKHAQHRSACNQSVLQYDRSARSSVCITPHLQALCPLTLIQKSKRSKQKSYSLVRLLIRLESPPASYVSPTNLPITKSHLGHPHAETLNIRIAETRGQHRLPAATSSLTPRTTPLTPRRHRYDTILSMLSS